MISRCFLLIAFGFCSVATADWADSFDDGFEHTWTFSNLAEDAPSTTFSGSVIDDALILADNIAATSGGATLGFGTVDEIFTDNTIAARLNVTNDQFTSPTQAVVARLNRTDDGTSFYAAEINYFEQRLVLSRYDSLTDITTLAGRFLPTLNGTDDSYIEFSLDGSELVVQAFDMPDGELLATISADDATFTEGLSGVLVRNTLGDNLIGAWDDVSATTPPPEFPDLECDVDGDLDCDEDDLNGLFALYGQSGQFDFDGNGTIGPEDIDGWLTTAQDPRNPAQSGDVELVRGDIDLDGRVDATDLEALLLNFNSVATPNWGSGDLDGNGVVNSADLGLLLNTIGHGVEMEAAASATAVPEPSGIGHWISAMLCGLLLARRRR